MRTLKILFFLTLMVVGLGVMAQPQDASAPHVDVIVIDGTINPAVDDFIRESIGRAKLNRANALVIQLDTPGGLLTSTRTIVKEILGALVPVIVYVSPSGAGAGSAGVFVTMSGHIAAMAPGTNIGAAHPVSGGGKEVKGVMGEKIENFTASFSESIAQQRGRNTEWAVQAVRKSVSITEREALKKDVIDIVAKDIDDLLRQADGRKVELEGRPHTLALKGVRIVRYEMSLKQRIINAIADPNIAYLFMMAGILGLYMEFSHPGVFFPGVAGAICLLLALASFQLLPINYTGLVLMPLGVALLVGEAFFPSFGVLGVGGIIAMALGSLLLFDTQGSDFGVDRPIVFTAVGTLGAFVLAVSYLVFRSQKSRPTLGLEGLLGEVGEVRGKLNPAGKIFVHGEYWNAQADAEIDMSEKVNAVLYFRVLDPNRAVREVENYLFATSQLAQVTLRSVCGQGELDELLAEREKINTRIQEILDAQTDPWGIKVVLVELKHIDLPQEMQRAMAKQAEAERERRAKVIHAEGEFQASQKLADAAEVIGKQPMALQLRFLQSLVEVASEKNSTTIFPVPIDLLTPFLKKTDQS